MSILQNLTEGVVNRDLSKEGEAILNKWEKTGLLEGLEGDFHRNQMAVLLENQAKELLRESNTMAGGDVEGFAAVAFPIVRRVFGGLLAQKLVSVQPMSLPSGLVFFMDFVKQAPTELKSGSRDGLTTDADGKTTNDPSVYGGQVKGSGILGGVELSPEARAAGAQTPQFFDLVQGHSAARGKITAANGNLVAGGAATTGTIKVASVTDVTGLLASDTAAKLVDFDADILALPGATKVSIIHVRRSHLAAIDDADSLKAFARIQTPDLRHLHVDSGVAGADIVRRLTKMEDAVLPKGDGSNESVECLKLVFVGGAANVNGGTDLVLDFAMADNITASPANPLGALVGAQAWEMEGSSALPEIAIKVDSTAITAVTRKLKASWTPELAQDLNAYHNLDAEVELTGILSEQIALEIDQEILSDLIAGASASKLYWSRRPGLFVNRLTGEDATSLASPPDFTGSVSEWYETLVETINDVSADIHRKTLRGGANFLVCGPEVANILEFTTGFRASVTHDDATGSVGAVQIGSINKKWDLHVDPYFPRNVILVGRKGGSFLESGFVYAPYVPLQVTPTIFDADDFTPRKAVMTRYGKKMVRPDMYGLVVVRDLEG